MNKPAPRITPAPPQIEAVTPFETTTTAVALVPSSLEGAMQLADWLSKAQLIKGELRGKPHDIFLMLLAGAELGLPPMASMRGIYVVNGKPALEAKTKSAICLQRGAALYFKKTEDTDKAVTWETQRAGTSTPSSSRFTIEDAHKAGVLGQGSKDGPWHKYPRRMMSWRALGFLCDDVYPDIVLGVATAEDFEPDQMTFRPIGVGVELGTPPAGAALEQNTAPTPQTATPPATSTPVVEKKPLSQEDIEDILTAIGQAASVDTLKEIARTRIAPALLDVPTRDRLAKAYEEQAELIHEAAKAERGGAS